MLRIEIVKHPSAEGVLRCTRRDGSVTWQKQDRHAAHFALHALTHFAVESVLRYRRGFFGLIAEGWDIEHTTGKGKRGRLPPEATEIQNIRLARGNLFREWPAVPPGGKLELQFDPD